MKLAVIGTGYVGLVTGTCLAHAGNDVTCMDLDAVKIETLRKGRIPIFEPGLEELVAASAAADRLRFTTRVEEAVPGAEIVVIAVGTPPGEDGGADLQHVLSAARSIAEHLSGATVIVNKSTVPVGTIENIHDVVRATLDRRGAAERFAVLSNPEFLREGAAIGDFMNPDRVVIGGSEDWAIERLRRLYAPFLHTPDQLIVTDPRSSELIKYAANAMLATRISFMNELANLAEAIGADIDTVRRGVGSDPRIGPHFLNAGCGYGGSCFPKDVKALIRFGQREGHDMNVVRAVEAANETQKQVLFRKLRDFFAPSGGLKGRTIALWGLAFKPNTDDLREAPSLALIEELVEVGAMVRCFDPVAIPEARRVLADKPGVAFCASAEEAVEGADALVLATEWDAFRDPDFARLAQRLRHRLVVDGRNLYDPEAVTIAGLTYASIGRRERVGASPSR